MTRFQTVVSSQLVLFAAISLLSQRGFAKDASTAGSPTAEEIVLKADEGRIPPGPMTIQIRIEDFEKEEKIHETKYKTYVGADLAYSMVDTLFPERSQGRKLLMDHDNLWLFTPDVKRAVRVSMQQRLTGEISNGDLSRTNFAGDYDAELLGKEQMEGHDCYHLMLKAKRPSVTYAKVEYWVTTDDFLPVKSIFFALSGKPIKSGFYSEPKMVMGHKRVSVTKFYNAIDKKRYSVLTYSDHKKATIPQSFFSKERLSAQ